MTILCFWLFDFRTAKNRVKIIHCMGIDNFMGIIYNKIGAIKLSGLIIA